MNKYIILEPNSAGWQTVHVALDKLQNDMHKIKSLLETLSNRIGLKVDEDLAEDLLPMFPIESRDAWNDFEEALKEADVRKQLVSEFYKIS